MRSMGGERLPVRKIKLDTADGDAPKPERARSRFFTGRPVKYRLPGGDHWTVVDLVRETTWTEPYDPWAIDDEHAA